MAVFDFLQIETRMAPGNRIEARATGILGPHLQSFVDQFFGVLNSLKVIAKKGEANVYNLYNPPQPTPAGMRALERKVKEVIFRRIFPATANLAITHRCQCKCVHCSAEPFVDPKRQELTTEDLKTVIDGALDLGASLVILVGGEPLLRKDLCELIAHIDRDKAMPMIFTNGLLLEQAAEQLAEAGLQTLNISIDSSEAAQHDEFRGVPRLYEHAFRGAAKCRGLGILTGISTYATGQNLRDGSLERLLR
ncbi:MAG: radical SAM protein, partial [Planctomycetota bacterium]